MENENIQEVTWREAREMVLSVQPDFAEVIDQLDPGDELTFFRVRYPYGEYVLKDSDLRLPDATGKCHSLLGSDFFPDRIKEKLGYSGTMPMGILLEKSLEQHIDLSDRVLPYVYVQPGRVFALWKVLDPDISLHSAKVWNITAGARSLFLLPKISDEVSFRRLKREFQLRSQTPKKIEEQWFVFKELAQKLHDKEPWNAELLFFSSDWLDHKYDNDDRWQRFYRYLYEKAWVTSQFSRNFLIFNLIFSRAQQAKNLRPNPLLADTVKHLLSVALSSSPGFHPANCDEAAPIFGLEKVFTDIYGLRNNYAAAFMQPGVLKDEGGSIYYSLRYPTALEFSPRSRNLSSTLKDLLEVKHIMDSVLSDFSGRQDLLHTPLDHLISEINFNYFHTETDSLGEIKVSSDVLLLDKSFEVTNARQLGRAFCESGQFFKGCISITKK